ncbi:MAG: ABC transporter substrate-binding protein [Flavobacteriales bacterium]|nr:ABC transporter substrate-binding protein [Flavobacteriales bacterium]MEB2341409.1 ABC transporter substrate-binding protein [Flavobacteriia bacterium]
MNLPLRIAGVPEPYNLPWHLAMAKGRFAEAGIDVQWHTVHEGTGRMCQMLKDDKLDMAVLVSEGAVRDILNGGAHRIVGTFVDSALPWGVHVPAASRLHAPGELKGVPYAISRLGSGSHIMAMIHAGHLGWRPGEKDLVVVHNMRGAAERMQAGPPVIFLWETYVTASYVDSGIMRRVDELRAPWPGFVIVAREQVLHGHSALIDRALAVLHQEAEGMKRGPHLVELVMRNAGFAEARAKEWLKHVHWSVDRPRPASFEPLVERLRRLELAPKDAHGPFL